MGTCNTLRTAETYTTENFTLIQLEEERQKLKKKELLKNISVFQGKSISKIVTDLLRTEMERQGDGK